jgi:hypothetical protein
MRYDWARYIWARVLCLIPGKIGVRPGDEGHGALHVEELAVFGQALMDRRVSVY